VTELGAGDISGMTLTAGVYKWGTGLLIAGDVTLTGSSTAVWILQVAKDLTVKSATKITLDGGALPKNVFWQVTSPDGSHDRRQHGRRTGAVAAVTGRPVVSNPTRVGSQRVRTFRGTQHVLVLCNVLALGGSGPV